MLYDLIFIAILVISVIWGIRTGAAKTLLSMAAFVLSLALSVVLSRLLSQVIYTSFIQTALQEKISSSVLVTPVGDMVFEAASFMLSLPVLFINSLEFFGIDSASLESAYSEGFVQSGESGAVDAVASVIGPVITGLIAVILGIILFIVLRLILTKVANLAAKAFRLPLIRIPDSLLGGLIGFVKGCVVVIALIMLLKLLSPVVPMDWKILSAESLEQSLLFSFVSNGGLLYGIEKFTYNIV